MNKIFEKKNFGLPTVLLTLFAYFIGYSMSNRLSNLLVAVIFAALVFSFDFDDAVKVAVKKSYVISFLFNLVYLGFDFINNLLSFVTPNYTTYSEDFNLNNFLFGNRALNSINIRNNFITYGLALIQIAAIVIYFIFILLALLKKDKPIGFISNILGEGTPKQKTQQPIYNQPPYQQAGQPVQPMYQNLGQPVAQPYQQNNQQGMYNQPPYQQPAQPVQQPQQPAQQAPVQPSMPANNQNQQ